MKYNLAVTHNVNIGCLYGVFPYGKPKQLNNCMININAIILHILRHIYMTSKLTKSYKPNNAFTAPCKGNFAKNV